MLVPPMLHSKPIKVTMLLPTIRKIMGIIAGINPEITQLEVVTHRQLMTIIRIEVTRMTNKGSLIIEGTIVNIIS